jgi:hypothetical protein
MRRLLEAAGFRIESWRDITAAGRAFFFEAALGRIAESGPAAGRPASAAA